MIIPRATYRLQFHGGFTLRDARELVPYFDALGVSHIYSSPLLMARPGSKHGYDGCDPTRINREIGTEADLEAFVAALRKRRMGLVLDIVPNHMATAPENPWWWDVLKHGRESRYADYFDIDWDSPDPRLHNKVLLPVLGDELEQVLERGDLKVVCQKADVTVRYFQHQFPVNPQSLLVSGKSPEELAFEANSNRRAQAELLSQQHYQLAFWRRGDAELNYRRFFTITHLAGLRVELPQVFADAHNRILDWHQRGWLDGFRVDHPDGLWDPQAYLKRLSQAVPGAWIVVEKILGCAETLPQDWPVAGTTGYDFLNRANGLFIDPASEKLLTDFYAEFTGEPIDHMELTRAKKRWILQHYLATEVRRLVLLLKSAIIRHAPETAPSIDELRDAIIELIACFPVYRTYCQADTGLISDRDKALISLAVAQALCAKPRLSTTVLEFLNDLLLFRVPGNLAGEFVMRFQQLTGPTMAKGVEDTVFYCHSRFIALNEVGGDPGRFGLSAPEFHRACQEAHRLGPASMLATSTHDTKRSEDVRARLALLSEIPERWIAAVRRWSAINEKYRQEGWPDRNAEYFFYQTLVGAWPLSLERALACLQKAACEAKQHTNWSDRNAAYEAALKDFVTGAMGDPAFLTELEQFVNPLVRVGYINSLAQTLLKLTVPGVPDIYQGTELWDLSLVDPDNRRPVDFGGRMALLAQLQDRLEASRIEDLLQEMLDNPHDGRMKLFILSRALHHRRLHPKLFQKGHYIPLLATGKQAGHVWAFARNLASKMTITVVPRLLLGLCTNGQYPPVGEETWEATRLVLPRTHTGRSFRNIFTGESVAADANDSNASMRLASILERFPVAILEKLDVSTKPTRPTIHAP